MDVVPLRNLRVIREAGLALCNCMGRAGRSERKRDIAKFLVRDRDGRAMAMFSARTGAAVFEPLELRGRYNREADAAAWSVTHLSRAPCLVAEGEKGQWQSSSRVDLPVLSF